ncbi:hypothetical protein [Spiroplasma ixodetis]|uniref:hypothetical protein n=1 Tax=Spiroplasma ixodetis TaxID=2141 RepID=UPI002577FBD0|nr:hypothetical protein [Spiroplasma ixodetis]WJG70917.1 hypothetical protein SIXOD_v1c22070 [Spiroplasma ixodetis Y32]
MKKYKKIYEQPITKTKEKYVKSIPLLNGLQLNQEQALLKEKDLISTISLKNNNNVLIKIKLTEQIENIYTSLFITNNQKSDTTSLLEFEDQQAETLTLLSDIYYDITPIQSQQNLSSFIIDTSTNIKEQSFEEIEKIKDEKNMSFLILKNHK